MSVSIKEVKTREDLKTFIYLPEKIHKNHKNWLHPLYMDDEKFFDKDKNSLFKHNEPQTLGNLFRDLECQLETLAI
jgi:hypothetical protein